MSERRKLRFGILDSKGRQSRVWSVSTVGRGSDVYLTPHGAPSSFHFSLHSETYWHMKTLQPRETGRGAVATTEHMAPDEEIPLGVIPGPFLSGLTRAFMIGISPLGLSQPSVGPDARVKWLPPPRSPGDWSHFNVFLAEPDISESLRMSGATVIGQISRGDGGTVFVTHHEEPLDTADLIAPPEIRQKYGTEISEGRLAAMLVLQNEDESWRVVEGPIEPNGVDGFDVACDRPWRAD